MPVSSEFYLLFILANGAPPLVCVLVATAGNTLGGMSSFGLGWLGKLDWVEKYLRIKREKLNSFQGRVDRWGAWLSWLTWTPFLGDPLAVALGFFKVHPLRVLPGMTIGKMARYAFLVYVSYEFMG